MSHPLAASSATPQRSELRTLVHLAVPISLAQLGLVAMGLVDTAIVGRLDVDSLAGTAMGRSIALAATGLGMGVGYALEPIAAQAVGAGEPTRAYGALRTACRVGLLVTVPSAALALAAAYGLGFVGVEPQLVPIVVAFLLGQLPGLFAFPLYVAAREYLASLGNTRPALVAAVFANIVNAIIGALLVHGDDALAWLGIPPLGLPKLGAFGAGLATSIASIVLAAMVLFAAGKTRPEGPIEVVPARLVFGLGLSIGTQFLAEIGLFSIVGLMAGRLGAVPAAAHQVALALVTFTFMGVYGIGAATGVRVGHAVGAGQPPRRIGAYGLVLGGLVMLGAATLFTLAPRPLASLFTVDAEVLELSAELLGIAAVFQLFDGLQGVASGALRGAGDVRFPLLANLASHYLVGVPLAVFFCFVLGWGTRGLWWGITAGLATIAAVLVSRFFWLTRGRVARVG